MNFNSQNKDPLKRDTNWKRGLAYITISISIAALFHMTQRDVIMIISPMLTLILLGLLEFMPKELLNIIYVMRIVIIILGVFLAIILTVLDFIH